MVDNSVFNLLRSCQTLFERSCTILHTHHQCLRFLISSQPLQHLRLLLNYNHPLDVKCYLIVVLIFISLMTNDVDISS